MAGAAGLLFVAVLGFGASFYGFAEGDARGDEFDFDLIAALEPIGEDREVQIALSRHDRLMQLGVHMVEEGRVLLVQRGQAGGDLVFVAFGIQFERGMNVGFGINHLGQRHDQSRAAKRVTGMGVLQFDDRPDVAGVKAVDRRPVFPVKNVNLADLFGDPSVAIVKFHSDFHGARVEAEKRELAELGFAHGLEDIQDRLRAGESD